ncbi:DNA-processing protein DprA [Chryseobacterium indoltheticum]
MKKQKSYQFISVSGLALGADKEVHEQSLKHQIPTIGVFSAWLPYLLPF